MSADPWPWPADTQLDRARRIAQSYREALLELDAARCMQLDDRARSLGQPWVVPELLTIDHDTVMNATDLAVELHIPAATIRGWAHRGELPKISMIRGVGYRFGDVLELMAARRRSRIGRRN